MAQPTPPPLHHQHHHPPPPHSPPPPPPTPQDIFSLGCVIAELFLDGKPTFELAQLLAYRRRQYDPAPLLAGLDPDVRELVAHMLQLEPGGRRLHGPGALPPALFVPPAPSGARSLGA